MYSRNKVYYCSLQIITNKMQLFLNLFLQTLQYYAVVKIINITLLCYMLQCCHYDYHEFVTLHRSHSVTSHINQKYYSSLLTLLNTLSSPSSSHRSTTTHITSFPVISSTLFRHSTTIQATSETKTQAQRHNNLQNICLFQ